MRFALHLAVTFAMATPALPQQVLGQANHNGEQVVLFEDYTWRYDDDAGKRCTEFRGGVQLFALPSEWYPVPKTMEWDPWVFRHKQIFGGSVYILDRFSEGPALTTADILRFINVNRQYDSNYGLTVSEEGVSINGAPTVTLVSVIGTSETRVYSYAWFGNRAVLAVTWEHSYQYTFPHKDAHRSFTSQIVVAE
jgi:hypothetical protein